MFERLSPETMLSFRPIMFLGVFSVPLLPFVGMQFAAESSQYNLWAWLGLFVYWIVAPIFEHALGRDFANSTSAQISAPKQNLYYKLLVYMIVPAQLFLLIYGAYTFSNIDAFSLLGYTGWILSNGLCSGHLAYLAGHELLHKRKRTDQMMGSLLLASVCNTGFKIEHLRGHHPNIGTRLDVYSARLHQPLYDYILKTCYHNLVNPWVLEKERLDRLGQHFWSWRNKQIVGLAASAALSVTFYILFGVLGFIFFCLQSVVALMVLQIINYLQHYGLTRDVGNTSKLERPTAAHAWNSSFWLTNMILLHLPRHPDHHIHPNRGYQALQHTDESPQLPTGYAGMFVIALIPPLWFKIMNPRISVYQRARGFENAN